jgi:hypothetical protein
MHARTVLTFAVGAVIAFCVMFYYVDLLGLPFVLAPVGAIAAGMCSALFGRVVAIFAAAAVIGYVIVVFIWLGYAGLFEIGDRDGGKTMEMIFIFAPAGGVMIGLIAAAMLGWRVTWQRG